MSVVLTRSRLSNALRCYGSYALSLFGLVRISHMPLFVSVEPASVCQLRCPACPVGVRNKLRTNDQRGPDWTNDQRLTTNDHLSMSREVWERVLEQAAKTAWTMQFFFQGEPLLNKDLPLMIREAHDAGLYTIVSTNAQAMTPAMADALVAAGLDSIIISMDGLTEQSYSAYRVGGSLEKTKAALRYLREAKQKHQSMFSQRSGLSITLQCLRLKTNEHEWKAFKREYKTLGADKLVFKTAQLYDYENGHPLMPSDPRYSRYVKGKDGHYHRRQLSRGCLRVWSGVVVTTTGEVLPCCYDKAHEHAYGNIQTTPLKQLFTNEQAMAFRRAALNETPQICKECWR